MFHEIMMGYKCFNEGLMMQESSDLKSFRDRKILTQKAYLICRNAQVSVPFVSFLTSPIKPLI